VAVPKSRGEGLEARDEKKLALEALLIGGVAA
jgi:hypothetical protein